jgi:hypothetical protein
MNKRIEAGRKKRVGCGDDGRPVYLFAGSMAGLIMYVCGVGSCCGSGEVKGKGREGDDQGGGGGCMQRGSGERVRIGG